MKNRLTSFFSLLTFTLAVFLIGSATCEIILSFNLFIFPIIGFEILQAKLFNDSIFLLPENCVD